MIIEHFRPGQAPTIYRRFHENGRMAPDGVRYLVSWVDLDLRRCFQVMEAEGVGELKAWTRNWEDLIDSRSFPCKRPRTPPRRSR